jgi:integrase/recombinase XerD
MNDSVTNSNSPKLSIPAVRLVAVGDRSERVEPVRVTNLRVQRIEQFLGTRNLAANTRRNYERQIRYFMDWADKDWHTVTLNDLKNYKVHLEEKGLELGSVGAYITSIKSLFTWMVKAGFIGQNPAAALEIPVSPEPEGRNLEVHMVQKLFDALDSRGAMESRDRAILCLLIRSGLRAEEVSNLNVCDYNGVEVNIVQAKHDSVGLVPVDDETHDAIAQYLTVRWIETQESLAPDDPIFVSYSNRNRGGRLTYDGIYKIVKTLAKLAGLENIHPHRGRHTFISDMVENGVDAYLAMELSRQRSPKAFNRYAKNVRYRTAKRKHLESKGETERKAVSLKDMLRLKTKPVAELEVREDEIVEGKTYPMFKKLQMPKREVTVLLKLKVEDRTLAGRSKAKVRKEIENRVLSKYQMVKIAKRGEYDLTIPFEREDEVAAIVSEMLWEMETLAELEDCSVESEVVGVGV